MSRPAADRLPAAPPPTPANEPPPAPPPAPPRLLRIQEVAAATGLTPRSIRYYEEIGLLRPAARSQGAYRLYDASDLERLGFIRELRDDAGFSLAEIALLLEDEEARIRDRERFSTTGEPAERREILRDLIARMDRQVATLEEKADRLRAMIEAAEARRSHLRAHLEELEGGEPAHLPGSPAERPGAPAPAHLLGSPAPAERPGAPAPSHLLGAPAPAERPGAPHAETGP